MRSLLLLLTLLLVPIVAKAECGHVAGETAFFEETEAPDYFVLQHDFTVDASCVTWAVTYCLSLDNGLGGVVDYSGTRYFTTDSAGHLQTQGAIDDSPVYQSDPENYPYLSYTDLLFYTRDFPGTAADVVRVDIGLNDETITATLSIAVVPL